MKLVRSAPLALVTFCLSAMVLLNAFDAQAQFKRNLALVRAIEGSASYNYKGEEGSVAKHMFLQEGTVIKTSVGSHVDLYLGDNGPFVRVTPESSLTIDRLQFRESKEEVIIETSLNLRRGRVLGQVKKTSPASRYEVITPTMVAGIRGTKYDISATGETKVFDGQVVVAYSVDGQVPTYLINGGFKFDPNTQTVIPLDTDVDINFNFDPISGDESQFVGDGDVDVQIPGQGPRVITDVSSESSDPTDVGSDTGTGFISPVQGGK